MDIQYQVASIYAYCKNGGKLCGKNVFRFKPSYMGRGMQFRTLNWEEGSGSATLVLGSSAPSALVITTKPNVNQFKDYVMGFAVQNPDYPVSVYGRWFELIFTFLHFATLIERNIQKDSNYCLSWCVAATAISKQSNGDYLKVILITLPFTFMYSAGP